MADSGGVYAVLLDGVPVISFSGDTKPSSYTTIDNLHFTANTSFNFWIDDLAINDTTGDTHNSWCGDGHIEYLPDAGNGDASEWAGSDGNSVDNYLLTDDVPPDGDTTYIEDATDGHQDLATVATFDGTYKQVQFVWAELRARGIAGGEQVKPGLKTNGTSYAGPTRSMTTSYARAIGEMHQVNPQTLEGWTEAEVIAAQSRVETVV